MLTEVAEDGKTDISEMSDVTVGNTFPTFKTVGFQNFIIIGFLHLWLTTKNTMSLENADIL